MNALKLQPKQPHAIKIESLDMSFARANAILEVITDFANDLGFDDYRIKPLDCRSRDGFSPYSHNRGGLECIAFDSQYSVNARGGCGFDKTDATLENTIKYILECFLADKKLESMDYSNEDLVDELSYYENDSDDTVMFGLDIMLTSENSLNLRFTISAKDSPYHRQYDDLFEFDVDFRTPNSLKNKLIKISKDLNVKQFSSNLSDCF